MYLLAIDWFYILEKFLLVGFIISLSMVVAMYATYAERKVAAFLQDRIGPDRAGKFGLLQPLADGLKFIMKEEIIPDVSNKFLFVLGPCIAMLTALMAGVVVPWGSSIIYHGQEYALQITDINIGILYIFGVVSIGVYGIMIGGWASNNKFSLLGGIRASAQMISYEIAMGLSIISFVMMSVVLRVSNHERMARYTGLCAGVLVMAYISFEAPLSGMSMNPARTFASALGGQVWTALWLYFTAPPLAMLAAAQIYLAQHKRIGCAKLHHQNQQRCIHCGKPATSGATA